MNQPHPRRRVWARILVAVVTGVAGGAVAVAAPASASFTLCDPNWEWVTVSSYTTSGKVTKWSTHYKNDSTHEGFTWATEKTLEITASVSASGSASGTLGLKKIAEVSLGLTTGYGLSGKVSVTTSYSRWVEFDRPGKWVFYAGHRTGGGTYTHYRCNSTGSAVITLGSGSGSTYENARATGLIDCSQSVSDRVALDAKTKCG